MQAQQTTFETPEDDEEVQADDVHSDNGAEDADRKHKDMEEAAVVGRIFYYVFHGMINLILMLYDNDLRDQIVNLELWWPSVYVLLTVTSTYLFHHAKRRPGYLREEKALAELVTVSRERNETEQINQFELKLEIQDSKETMPTAASMMSTPTGGEASLPKVRFPAERVSKSDEGTHVQPNSSKILARLKEGYLQSKTEDLADGEDVELGGSRAQAGSVFGRSDTAEARYSENQREDAEVSIPEDNLSNMSQLPPGKRFCKKCNLVQNYRTKHCKSCGECVAKFDHHCYFIGGCVGELNHRKFLLMLISMQVQYFFVCKYLWSGLEVNSDNYSEEHPEDPRKYTKEYGAFFMSAVVGFVASGLVALLLGYHSYLCVVNETTWENVSGHKIDYMAVYPSGYKPFSRGIWYNLKYFFFHGNQIKDWELPDIKQTWKREEKDTCWKNQYYSCC